MPTMKRSKITLEILPNELILSIIDHLAQISVLHLRLVNKRFYNLTLNQFYNTFNGPHALKFLRTIALPAPHGQPDWAKRVKHAEWTLDVDNVCTLRPSDLDASQNSLTAQEKWAVAHSYRHLNFALQSERPEELPLDVLLTRHTTAYLLETHFFLELFLSFLPNIESLVVNDAWQWDDHTYWFKHISANAERFAHLWKISVHGPLRVENVTPLLALPALRDLEMSQVLVMRREEGKEFDWEHENRYIHLPDKSSGIEQLVLNASYIPTSSLVLLLRAIRSLKDFTYEHMPDELSHPPGAEVGIEYQLLARALNAHSATLKYLSLKAHEHTLSDELVVNISCTSSEHKLDVTLAGEIVRDVLSNALGDAAITACIEHLLPKGLDSVTLEIGSRRLVAWLIRFWGERNDKMAKWAHVLAQRGLGSVKVRHVSVLDGFKERERKMWGAIGEALANVGVGMQIVNRRGREMEI